MPGGTKPPVGPLAHEVASIIRGHLARIGWTHGQLGKKVGISTSQVSRMLRGDRHMDVDQLFRICEVLDLKVPDVLADAEDAVVNVKNELRNRLDEKQRPERPTASDERAAGM